MSGSNYCSLCCIKLSQEAGKVVWYSHFLKNSPHFVVIHTTKGFSIVNEAEIDVCFFVFEFSLVDIQLYNFYIYDFSPPLPMINMPKIIKIISY